MAENFEKVADLVEIEGESRFEIKVYWGAARTVGGYSRTAYSRTAYSRTAYSRTATLARG